MILQKQRVYIYACIFVRGESLYWRPNYGQKLDCMISQK